MRLYVIAITVAILCLPAVANQQQAPTDKKDGGAANLPSQSSPVTVVISQPTTQAQTDRPCEQPRKGPPIYSNWALVIAAGVAAWAGIKNLGHIRKQSKATETAAQAAHDGVILARRPRLIIRWIEFHSGSIIEPDADPTQIKFVIANTGGSKAAVTESNFTSKRIDGPLPPIPPYSAGRSALGNFELAAGEYREAVHKPDPTEPVISRMDELMKSDSRYKVSNTLYFFGYIQYRDEIGIFRRTAFCRLYDIESKRFTPVGDSEYEYSD